MCIPLRDVRLHEVIPCQRHIAVKGVASRDAYARQLGVFADESCYLTEMRHGAFTPWSVVRLVKGRHGNHIEAFGADVLHACLYHFIPLLWLAIVIGGVEGFVVTVEYNVAHSADGYVVKTRL